jgi:hypothetical protein
MLQIHTPWNQPGRIWFEEFEIEERLKHMKVSTLGYMSFMASKIA